MNYDDPYAFDESELPEQESEDYVLKQFESDPPKTAEELRRDEAVAKETQRFEAACTRHNMFEVLSANDWIRIGSRQGKARHLFGDLWCENELTIMFADTGVGKSLLAMQIADSIVRGRRIEPFEMTAKPQRVLLLDFEMTHRQLYDRYSTADPVKLSKRKPHEFHRDILRAEIDWQKGLPDGYRTYADFVLGSIQQSLTEYEVRVLIVDNISWLVAGGFAADAAARLMKGLKLLKTELGVSILVLAHSIKRPDTLPITIDALAGSKSIVNFADNVFAIGRSIYQPEIRYLKQLKQRNSVIRHDTTNVAAFRIITDESFPRFRFIECTHEAFHLRRGYDTLLEREPTRVTPARRVESVRRFSSAGLSYRQIADRLNISKYTVARILKSDKP